MTTIIVIDFETTGMSPDYGARVIEAGAVRIENDRIVDSFQSLMNAGVYVPPFIEQYTGINNQMLRTAPPNSEVMAQLADFIADIPLVAHNAGFERRFLGAELACIGRQYAQDIACSLLLARRVYPDAGRYRLGDLVEYAGLPNDGVYHRALADATMTAHLWLRMQSDLQRQYDLIETPFALLQALQKIPKRKVAEHIHHLAKEYYGNTG